ncbi:MAG: cobalamin biosynthesis protein CobD [Bradyrhizobium sp.]|nr:cobalamin biosynthesis protein CobD [Bradyrhizobium sp.]
MMVAMVADALLGWPNRLFVRIGHPVTWLGRLIGALDARWNRETDAPSIRRAAGVAAALLVIALAAGIAWAVQHPVPSGLIGKLLLGILAWPFVAFRSLYDHVAAVRDPLRQGDIEAARNRLALIVGRDPAKLDEAGIARASLESLAENASDGVVAPVFWGVLLGLPGIVGYKAVNTLDSMIGHRTARHQAFGWAAARIDDVANFVPARLTGLLFAALAASEKRSAAMSCMWKDARHHRSINAGWPEAALAGALGVRLCGPRSYHGELADEPWLNASARDPAAGDITRALESYVGAMFALTLLLVVLAIL